MQIWKAVRILSHVAIAALLYLAGRRAGRPLLGLFGALFWSLYAGHTVTEAYLSDRSRRTPGAVGGRPILAFGDSFTLGAEVKMTIATRHSCRGSLAVRSSE